MGHLAQVETNLEELMKENQSLLREKEEELRRILEGQSNFEEQNKHIKVEKE